MTIDTEVDKDHRWRVAEPPSFRSVLDAVPNVLSPLFDEFGAVPTYMLSPEVIEDGRCAEVLACLGDRAELATHLHAEFVDPQRTLWPETMAGKTADAIQSQYPREVEAAKLRNLTGLFERVFSRRPTAFRAGRYGLSPHTHQTLAELGYLVESSVTPGLRWRYPQGTLDYRKWTADPRWLESDGTRILELPIGIRPGGRPASWLRRAPEPIARAGRAVLGDAARHRWLRPTWEDGDALVQYVDSAEQDLLVLMFHSIEIVPGASPYASRPEECDRIVGSIRRLLEHCVSEGIGFSGLSEAAAIVPA